MTSSDRYKYVLLSPCFLLSVWLVPFVYESSELYFGMFELGGKTFLGNTQRVKTIGPGVPQERPKSVQGGPSSAVPKNKMAPKWKPKYES